MKKKEKRKKTVEREKIEKNRDINENKKKKN